MPGKTLVSPGWFERSAWKADNFDSRGSWTVTNLSCLESPTWRKPSLQIEAGPSEPKADAKKRGSMVCQHCWQYRSSDVPMLRCNGCQVDTYCCQECQKAAWSEHKPICQIAMSLRQEHPNLSAHARALQKLCNKHIGTMTTCGVHALNLHNNPSASRTDALVIEVRPLHADEAPGFYCVGDARVESIANFSDVESTAGILARNVENVTNNEHSPVGDTNDVFFAMVVGPPGLTVVMPLVYTKLVYPCDESFAWRDELLDAMNKSVQTK